MGYNGFVQAGFHTDGIYSKVRLVNFMMPVTFSLGNLFIDSTFNSLTF